VVVCGVVFCLLSHREGGGAVCFCGGGGGGGAHPLHPPFRSAPGLLAVGTDVKVGYKCV